MNKSPKFSPEVRERAVRMVQEHRADYSSLWAAIESIAPKISCVPQTLNDWVKKAEADSGQRPGITTSDAQRIKELEHGATAVGVYPHGSSSEGVLDLSGNVWEWCLNQYGQPEQIRAYSSGEARVLRGGSWDDYPDRARISFRYGRNPGYRDNVFDFRVVSSATIS